MIPKFINYNSKYILLSRWNKRSLEHLKSLDIVNNDIQKEAHKYFLVANEMPINRQLEEQDKLVNEEKDIFLRNCQ